MRLALAPASAERAQGVCPNAYERFAVKEEEIGSGVFGRVEYCALGVALVRDSPQWVIYQLLLPAYVELPKNHSYHLA